MISILLPTYNQARFLPDALASLAAQTRPYELVACDDGSTDGTADILKAVRTVTHPVNRGTAAAINSAAQLAKGEYLTWVSSDNIMYPEWLDRLLGALRSRREWGAVYSAYRTVEEQRRRLVSQQTYNPNRLVSGDNCYFGPSFLIRREVWQEHRGGSAHDYDNWARVEEACWARGWTIGCVNQPLCDYRRGEWNTCRRHPELYDAPRWRSEAIERRKVSRNWLGDIVAGMVLSGDEVLDLGCGIMPATGGRLAVKKHVGLDSFQPYLDRIGPPTINGRLPGALEGMADKSFDVVMLLDVIEHLEKSEALAAITGAERLARRMVILFTPEGFVPQHGYEAWGMADNADQAHRCGFGFDELSGMGYECRRLANGTQQQGGITSVLGVKKCPSIQN